MLKTILFFLACSVAVSAQNIEAIDQSKLDELINNRNGKILLLNVWATWCLPCKEEVPDLNKVEKQYSKSVDVVGLSTDYPDEIESRIIPFINKNNILYEVSVSAFKKDADLINYLHDEWGGSLPATFIYDSKGKLIHFVEGKEKFSYFEAILDKQIQ